MNVPTLVHQNNDCIWQRTQRGPIAIEAGGWSAAPYLNRSRGCFYTDSADLIESLRELIAMKLNPRHSIIGDLDLPSTTSKFMNLVA